MRVLIINSVCGQGSTGRICTDLAEAFTQQGHEVKIAYGRDTAAKRYEKYAVKIGTQADLYCHGVVSRLCDAHGLGSVRATKRFIQWADSYQPDLLWLHNLHGYYINYPLLFRWIKSRPTMQVKWTLHDCWAFTGHCSYFTMAGCNKWQTRCHDCPQPKKYPGRLLFDRSEKNFEQKQNAFCGVKDLTLITPSRWLADLVKLSFLKEYPVEVIPNTVDATVFHPSESDFRKRYALEEKKMVLGVACPWDERKGLEDFVALSERLSDDYKIVLVGLTPTQQASLPPEIIGMGRTNDATELAEIYSAADVFVNPTYEDNYPTTNLEAAACGTPVITYDTGGSPESAQSENVVPCGDLDALYRRIIELV